MLKFLYILFYLAQQVNLGKLYGKFTETVTTKKILDVKQIKALLFFKKSTVDDETYKAEHYYEIPLEVEK